MDNRRVLKKHEKPGIKNNEDLIHIKLIITSHDFSPDYPLHQPKLYESPQVNIHWIYSIKNIFTVQDFWATLRLPSKIDFSLKIFTVLNCHSRFLSNSALTLENRVCPENFHCIQYTFCIQDFWATYACPEFAVLNIYCYNDLRWGLRLGRHCLFQSQICECMNWME